MGSTRWKKIAREFAGRVHRELRLGLTPVVRPDKWVFIVGCYNSGTELLVRLLETHPAIAALPVEGQFLTDQLTADYEIGLPRMWVLREDLFRLTEADVGPDVDRLKKEWLMRLDRRRAVFLEKSPPNAARTRWLQRHFENAHFIAIVRNGYAVAEGIRRKAEPYHLVNGWPIALCARQWARSNEVLLHDGRELSHLHWVRYEDVTRDPHHSVNNILAFLGLSVEQRVELDGPIPVHEKQEPIRDMNADSFKRLSRADIQVINQEAAHMLSYFNYELLS